jgi:hypothetical protein
VGSSNLEDETMVANRFFAMTAPANDGSGCLLWTGSKNQKGYGRILVNGKNRHAHRIAWELANGTIPEGMQILHRCDNPTCVNQAHLFTGTNQDNVTDMMSKGRFKPHYGETNGRSKLTKSDVLQIRASSLSNVALGKLFGVSNVVISGIRRGVGWKEIQK